MCRNPLFKEATEGFQFEEELFAIAHDGLFATDCAVGLKEFACVIGCATDFTAIAILVLCMTLGTFTLHETARQEHFAVVAVELLHGAARDVACVIQLGIDALGQDAVFIAVGRAITIKAHLKGAKFSHACFVTACD